MGSPAPVIPVLLEVDFATNDGPCFQHRHFDCAVLVAVDHLSTSSRWIVVATAPGAVEIAAVRAVVEEAGVGFLLWVMATLSTYQAWNQFFQKRPRR